MAADVPVTLSEAQAAAIAAALASAQTNGQAVAVVDLTLAMADKAVAQLHELGTPAAEDVAKALGLKALGLRELRRQLDGAHAQRVGATWHSGKAKVARAWELFLTLDVHLPTGQKLDEHWYTGVSDALAAVPEGVETVVGAAVGMGVAVAKTVLGGAGDIVKTGVSQGTDIAGLATTGLLKKVWPFLIVAGLGAAAYFYFKGRALSAVTP
jgi:hypothetical protein